MNAIQSAFVILILYFHVHGDCPAPQEAYSSDFIVESCQKYTQSGMMAESCYLPLTQTIVLPTSCQDAGTNDHYCNRLAYHEVDRHIEQVCLHHVFTDAEPKSVLEAEAYAP